MKAMFEALQSSVANVVSYISTLVRASVAIPLIDDKDAGAESSAPNSGSCVDTEFGEAAAAYHPPRHSTKHPGYMASNGLGSLEVGGADN